jgi:hypothetical protein
LYRLLVDSRTQHVGQIAKGALVSSLRGQWGEFAGITPGKSSYRTNEIGDRHSCWKRVTQALAHENASYTNLGNGRECRGSFGLNMVEGLGRASAFCHEIVERK